jgi:hypothetical protein
MCGTRTPMRLANVKLKTGQVCINLENKTITFLFLQVFLQDNLTKKKCINVYCYMCHNHIGYTSCGFTVLKTVGCACIIKPVSALSSAEVPNELIPIFPE